MYSFQIKVFPCTGLNHKPIIYTEATDLLETKRKTTKCLFGGHYKSSRFLWEGCVLNHQIIIFRASVGNDFFIQVFLITNELTTEYRLSETMIY